MIGTVSGACLWEMQDSEHVIQTKLPTIKCYETMPPLFLCVLLISGLSRRWKKIGQTVLRSSSLGVNPTSPVIAEQVIYGKIGGRKKNSFLKKNGRFNLSAWAKIGQWRKQTMVTWADGTNLSGKDWRASLEIVHISINHVDNWLELQKEEVSHKASLNRRWYRTSSSHCPEIDWQFDALRMGRDGWLKHRLHSHLKWELFWFNFQCRLWWHVAVVCHSITGIRSSFQFLCLFIYGGLQRRS